MPTGSGLPPDIQARMEQQPKRPPAPTGGGGIGSRAHENATTAHQRNAAMNPDAPLPLASQEPEQAEAEKADLKICPNPRCKRELTDDWNFCAVCGTDLIRGGAAKRLGIEFTEQDLQDYIFKGYVVRELKILGNHSITVKSSQPSDVAEVDDYIMNGDWGKQRDGKEKKISDFYVRQINSLAMAAASVMKFDGEAIGGTLVQRMAYFMDRGSVFADLICNRVVMFNKALTDHLMRHDTLLGS